jgi:hypothetical protein
MGAFYRHRRLPGKAVVSGEKLQEREIIAEPRQGKDLRGPHDGPSAA